MYQKYEIKKTKRWGGRSADGLGRPSEPLVAGRGAGAEMFMGDIDLYRMHSHSPPRGEPRGLEGSAAVHP